MCKKLPTTSLITILVDNRVLASDGITSDTLQLEIDELPEIPDRGDSFGIGTLLGLPKVEDLRTGQREVQTIQRLKPFVVAELDRRFPIPKD
jgi:hypothetical protein